MYTVKSGHVQWRKLLTSIFGDDCKLIWIEWINCSLLTQRAIFITTVIILHKII